MSIPFPATGLLPFPLPVELETLPGTANPARPVPTHPVPILILSPSPSHPTSIIPIPPHPHSDSLQLAGWRRPVRPDGGEAATIPPPHPTLASPQPRAPLAPDDASPCPILSAGCRPAPSSCPGFGAALGARGSLKGGWEGGERSACLCKHISWVQPRGAPPPAQQHLTGRVNPLAARAHGRSQGA